MKKLSIIVVLVLFTVVSVNAQFPLKRSSEKDVFPNPINHIESEVNPPAFVWLPVENAANYTLLLYQKDVLVFQKTDLKQNVFAANEPFAPGQYHWRVKVFDNDQKLLAESPDFHFSIPADAVEFPYPDIQKLARNISDQHPRLIFSADKLDEFRRSLSSGRRDAWNAVKAIADKSLSLDNPVPPWYGDIEDYGKRRLEYRQYYHYIREYIDQGLQALGIAWLMTGESKYADTGKRILLTIAGWHADGITSSKHIGFDEPGLSIARCLHRGYDWLYTALSEEERNIVRKSCIDRARDTYQRIAFQRPFLQEPGASHDARLIGYLSEQALVLHGEIPDEDFYKWLDFSLTGFWTVFPHWGGKDGGWAEGTGYAAAYNIRATTWIESVYSVLGLNLWEKPFFSKLQNFFLYCARPNGEFWPYGDGAERGPRQISSRAKLLVDLMTHYAQRFENPVNQWWADNVVLHNEEISNPVIPMILPKKVKATKPVEIEQAKLFQDIGWSAFHSDLSDLESDVFFLFKSSPYGSYSHSHADQNSFYLSVGGYALAIPSGYYGPVYGAPHHAEWTRSSKANNTILVNGEGQTVRDFEAVGKITAFRNNDSVAYVCGDAAPAYSGKLELFDRHVMYVRPGLFVILDDLKASEPSTFQWMLHALNRMEIDESQQTITIDRPDAKARFYLFTSPEQQFHISQTDTFDTPFNAGSLPKYHREVENQWHITAATQKSTVSTRIAAFVTAGTRLPNIEWVNADGWTGAKVKYSDGTAEVWAQLEKDRPVPDELQNLTVDMKLPVIGLWRKTQ
ncbi:DUF4962 domain-containing protein [candidate division KSB1 bacterium]|nr:DUF4962 domain-containing protein [candidate division KSB1 bacterium]